MSFISLLPFFVIFSFTILFKKIIIAMLAGIASVIVIKWLIYAQSMPLVIKECIDVILSITTHRDYVLPMAFFTMVTFIVDLLCYSGIMAHYKAWMRTKITSSKELEKTTLLLAPLFFIDDYLSSLSLGAFIRPLLDCYHVARSKFAYLLNSSSSSLCVIIPLSSWSIMTMGQLKNVLQLDSFMSTNALSATHILLFSTPFLLYPLSTYFFAWVVVYQNISFGSMRLYEEHVKREDKENENTCAIESHEVEHNKKWVFFVPFALFFAIIICQLIRTYRSMSGSNIHLLAIIEKADLASAMVSGVILGFFVLCVVLAYLKILSWQILKESIESTIKTSYSTLSVLILAWVVGSLLKGIGALDMFSSVCTFIPTFNWYPLILFTISFLTCTAIGSSWGTIALLMPLLAELKACDPLFMYIALASLVSGALAGTHFTPISDAMIMASTSAGCNTTVHFKTHINYAIIPLAGSLCGLLFISFYLSKLSYPILAISSIILALSSTATLGYFRMKFEKKS